MPPPFTAPLGTRFPQAGDDALPFAPKGALHGRVDWAEFLGYHAPREGRFTLLAMHDEAVVAAASFEVRREDIFVAYLARNDLFQPPMFIAGGSVLLAALDAIATQLHVPAIRLESVDDAATISWYESRGFAADGPPRFEPGWGTLFPMVRRVPHGGAP